MSYKLIIFENQNSNEFHFCRGWVLGLKYSKNKKNKKGKGRVKKKTPEFETFVRLGQTPPPLGKLRRKKLGQNTKKLTPPPFKKL